jgi:hypothetical protein
MFASYSEMCEIFGGRGYNFTARREGAQLTLSYGPRDHSCKVNRAGYAIEKRIDLQRLPR